MDFLYTAISWVLLRWHSLFTAIGLDEKGGLNWALSIVFLVVTVRLLLFRLFIKQVHYQRHMMEMQPKIKKLQEKYKGDRAALNREMMKLQQEEGFNPLSGCLPMFLQIPVFISLFHVLRHLSNAAAQTNYPAAHKTLYGFTATQTDLAAHAKLFGAPLAARLFEPIGLLDKLGGTQGALRAVILPLVVISAAATHLTQRTVIANQFTKPEGQAALIQKFALYGIPMGTLFSGLIFPIGVLIYWFTSNVWTMGQQFYIHRFHPYEPGAAAKAAADKAASRPAPASAAPKPGQKPTRPAKSGPANTAPPAKAAPPPKNSGASTGSVEGVAPAPLAKPKPGQRPAPRKKKR